ncbi:hypothetical protein THAOC_24846, partial [Thalassiosira oceanica]
KTKAKWALRTCYRYLRTDHADSPPINSGVVNGTWVLLQNCKLGLGLMNEMESIINKLRGSIDPNFRLGIHHGFAASRLPPRPAPDVLKGDQRPSRRPSRWPSAKLHSRSDGRPRPSGAGRHRAVEAAPLCVVLSPQRCPGAEEVRAPGLVHPV